MAGHDELREQAGLYVLGALTPAEQAAFEAHLATCGECAAEVRTLSSVAGALVHAVPQSEPSPALRARVLAAVGASPSTAAQRTIAPEAAIARDTASAADTTIARDARVAPDARFGPEASIVRTNTLAPWLAAAASLALAVALGAYAAMLRTRVGDLEVRLRQATLRADASERQVADARRTAADAQSEVAVLAAPDLARIDLAGQPAAPQASARAFWSRSRGLVFTASNLPAPPAGRTYQLWILTAQPAPVSAGLLKPDANGRVNAVFETPPDLPKPTAMAVTIEPDGGVPAPTGDKYLVGLATSL